MRSSASSAKRQPTNVSLDRGLVEAAKELGVNLSRACELGLAEQVSSARRERWLAENREAIESSNRYVEEYGLPLARYRLF